MQTNQTKARKYQVEPDEEPDTASPRRFIEVWQTSKSLAEVASKVQRTKSTCRVRAYRYRQRGIPLKEFPPVEYELTDWDELARFAEELARKAPEADQGPSESTC